MSSGLAHDTVRIALAQVNLLVGDIEGNSDKVISWCRQAVEDVKADIIVFPELTLTSYPPEDLLYRQGLYRRVDQALERIRKQVQGITLVLGYPQKTADGIYNAAAVIADGEVRAVYRKTELPNYGVFDEKRYFIPGSKPCVVEVKGVPLGISICEDAWHAAGMRKAVDEGAQLILNLNASPYHFQKERLREQVIRDRAIECGVPIVYTNLVGGQDELVFDGGSFVMNADGQVSVRARRFVEHLVYADFQVADFGIKALPQELEDEPGDEEQVYQALVLGVRDYVHKNRFNGAVIGLSGGIDSALTLAVAADALGAENLLAVSMPSEFTAQMSIDDARAQAQVLGVSFEVIPISRLFDAFADSLAPVLGDSKAGVTGQNLQARIRGVLLMAVSNKTGRIVLSTGNKSELAVGYCTIYGDMVGGFSVLKDVPKTLVYRLAEYRNRRSQVIPARVIERPPSAELAVGQKDEDSLPAYEILDPILEMYVEQDLCLEEIVAKGFEAGVVKKVIGLVNGNEYKRRQAVPGVRVTSRAFGRDRRYPITSGFHRLLSSGQ